VIDSGDRVVDSLRWNVPRAVLGQVGAEVAWLLIAVVIARWLDGQSTALTGNLVPAFVFALIMVAFNGAFGLYRRDLRLGFGTYVGRLLLAMLIGAPIAYATANMLPGGDRFQDVFGQIVILAFAGLVVVRHIVVSPLLRSLHPHRILVLGTGVEARVVESSLEAADAPGIKLVGFYALEKRDESVIPSARVLSSAVPLLDTVQRLGIREIIVAVRDQRGGVLSLRSLLECRLSGVQVTDLARFFERVHGRIPITSLKASWLIYGQGFRQGVFRTVMKRAFDIVASFTLIMLALPIAIVTAILIVFESGAPIIYRQERVGLRGRTFHVLKFRSMRADAEADGKPAWAMVDDPRVTRLGAFLRRSRVDELPQLINVLRGEMSLVGPRPERPAFVALLTERIPFYSVRHSVKPGITGWAQVRYSYGANVEESMSKLEYDLYYVKNHTLYLDLLILFETVRVVLLGQGAR
jgi:sugar transferase (PEP-CTERM system associated)